MLNLKLLSLNLHCLEENNIPEKQDLIVETILEKEIDIIFLQEVAQYADSPLLFENIKETNYGFEVQEKLRKKGVEYFYYFDIIKHSFGKYDEGIAILSKYELYDIKANYISKSNEFHFWRTRKMIKGDLHLQNNKISLVSSHLGWTDEYENFENQVERMLSHVDRNNILLLVGDFNVSPGTEEYKYILSKELVDLYGSNKKYLFDPTHKKNMDLHQGETRIDYFFSNHKLEVINREILFSRDTVSDHYGVFIEVKI